MSEPTNIDFLDGVRLTDDQLKSVALVANSKDLRIYAFSKIQDIFSRLEPTSMEVAAARYYEAKSLMGMIKNITK